MSSASDYVQLSEHPHTEKLCIDDQIKPLMDRIEKLEKEVAVLEFHRNALYEFISSIIKEGMERDRKTWVAGSCGGAN